MIKLELVNEKTFRPVVRMKLTGDQDNYVADNVMSLAQAWLYYDNARPYAILNDDEVVGFMMLDWDESERTVGIWRFMIAQDKQHLGYGKKAMLEAMQMIKESKLFDLIYLDYVPGNVVAKTLYESLGFRETGEVDEGEIVMTLKITDCPHLGYCVGDDDDIDEILNLLASEKKQKELILKLNINKDNIEELLDEELITRVVLYGKAVGVLYKDMAYLHSDYQQYKEELEQKVNNQ